jgi:biopolymer transport protein ExbB
MRHRLLSGWFGAGLRLYLLWFLALGTFSLAGFVDATAVLAAEEEAAEPAAEEEGLEELPDFGGEEAAAPAEREAADAGAAVQEKTYLAWMYEALGIFYSVVFLALSFTLVALLVMNLLTARRESILPVGLVEGFEAQLNEKKYQDAYEMAKSDDSFLGQVLSAGLAKLSAGYEPAIEAMQEVGEEENMKLEHRLSYMALIGTISPMIGLLGTVQGMIRSFSVIANSPTTPKPSELAAGISTALFTTLVGLFIAIPAIALYNILRNRVARLVLEVGIVSEGLMSRFSGVGTKKT